MALLLTERDESGTVHLRPAGVPLIIAALATVRGVLVFVAGAALVFTGRYPEALFDLTMGIERWTYRVLAYASLMTDEYPPFRLDAGTEPVASLA